MLRRLFAFAAALLLSVVALVNADPQVVAQAPTETPVLLNLSSVEQSQGEQQNPGEPTPTRTATPQGIALLEAKEFANVRAEPSTDSAQLGTIRLGEQYNVIGRYVSWIQFEFQSSPTGKGWVYGELVNLSGNTENIPDIDPYGSSSVADNAALGATGTQNAITQTPGGVLTATIISRESSAPGAATPTDSGTHEILPTFTYPPGMVAVAPTPGAQISTESSANDQPVTAPANGDGLPPIAPILVLGGVGLLGLALSALRRG